MWFSHLYLNRGRKERLLKELGSPEKIYNSPDSLKDEILEMDGRLHPLPDKKNGEAYKMRWDDFKDLSYYESVWKEMQEKHIRMLPYTSGEYPTRLLDIKDYPFVIYVRGKLPARGRKMLAVIGSRKASLYGIEVAKTFSQRLAGFGIGIVSGLANGIDGAAHSGALEADGYTLGAIGSGLFHQYPKENWNLYTKMYETGGVFTEWFPSIQPRPENFPARNRLISAMSDGILVVEARKRSGTFITVEYGLEQGKDIFIVPGRITDTNSIGCLKLWKEGAYPVTSPNDILEILNDVDAGDTDGEAESRELQQSLLNGLSQEEKQILAGLNSNPIYVEELANALHMQITKLTVALLHLELEGYVKQPVKNYYCKTANLEMQMF